VFALVSSALLPFVPQSLRVMRVLPTPERVTIEAAPRSTSAACPVCCNASRRVHSSYRRVLHDLPWQERPVTIHVAARRFHCSNRRTFAERLMDVPHPFGRRTGRLRDLQHQIGLALGGEAGARMAARISARQVPIPCCVSRPAAVSPRLRRCRASSASTIGLGDAVAATARCW
jgi:hypothetical protein